MKNSNKKYQELSACNCFAIRSTARLITQFYESYLKAADIKPTQFTILAILASAGDMTVMKLADIAATERTGITRNLRLLERKKWIISYSGKDKRQKIISLSKDGYKKLDEAMPLWQEAQEKVTQGFGSDYIYNFLNNLEKINKITRTPHEAK